MFYNTDLYNIYTLNLKFIFVKNVFDYNTFFAHWVNYPLKLLVKNIFKYLLS